MTSRERVRNAITFKEIDRVPICGGWEADLGSDVYGPRWTFGKGYSQGSPGGTEKFWVDHWGSVWERKEDGVTGEVKTPLLDSWSKLKDYKAPWDVIDDADMSLVDGDCENDERFMCGFWQPIAMSPFQTMQYLRGTENLFMDMAMEEDEFFELKDMVHSWYVKMAKLLCSTKIDAIHLEDDWGTQISLLISPDMWREIYKPLYKEYCDIAHASGKLVIMHSDGMIDSIIPDLAEIGVNSINAQLPCMDVAEVARKYHGVMSFWGGIDRQYLLPFGTPEECAAQATQFCDEIYKYGKTGFVGECMHDKDAKPENVKAALMAFANYKFK